MNINMDAKRAGAILLRIIIDMAILIAVTTVFVSCGTSSKSISSKPPVLVSFDSHPSTSGYLREFRQMTEKYYWAPVSPDQKWELYIQRENAEWPPGGFYSLRLRDTESGDSRILFTLWDADVGSGVRANVRWSSDGKALQIQGDTRGFSYEPRPDAMKYESFNLLYLVEEDKILSIPKAAV